MEQLRNYVLSSEHLNHKLRLLKSTNHHHDAPTRLVLRNAFDPINLLPLLLQINLFREMRLPLKIQHVLARSIELHIVPPLQKVVTDDDIPPHSPGDTNLTNGLCRLKDLAFLILTPNSIDIMANDTLLCTLSAGDAVGAIPERHVFSEFTHVYSRAAAAAAIPRPADSPATVENGLTHGPANEPIDGTILLAFPVLMLRNSVAGGLGRVLWHQHSWIDLFHRRTSHLEAAKDAQDPTTIDTLDTVLTGLLRPIMLNIAPRRSDIKQLIPLIRVASSPSRGGVLFDGSANRPKQSERYFFIVARGSCSVKSWEEDDHKQQKGQIYQMGQYFGVWCSSDRRCTVVKSLVDDTIVLKISELHVDHFVLPHLKRGVLKNRNFINLVNKNLNTDTTPRFDSNYHLLHALGRSFMHLKNLSTNIRNRLLNSSSKFIEMKGVVWNEHDHAGYVIVLLQGALVARNKRGKELKRYVPGDMVGDSAFNDFDYRFCTLETFPMQTSVKVLSIGVPEFLKARREQSIMNEQLLATAVDDPAAPSSPSVAAAWATTATGPAKNTTNNHQQFLTVRAFPLSIPLPLYELLHDTFTTSKDIELREAHRSQNEFRNHLPLMVEFLSSLSFFKQFQHNRACMKAFAKCCGYKKIPAFGLLILEDSPNVDQSHANDLISKEDKENVFVVVSGSVNIYKKNVAEHERASTICCGGSIATPSKAKQVQLGSLLAVLSQGDCIGEKHVMKSSSKRNASAVARETSEVLIFCAKRFKTIIEATHIKLVAQPELCKRILSKGFVSRNFEDIAILMQLVQSSAFFHQFSLVEMKLMCRYLKFKKLAKGKKLFSQGEPGSRFYIITSGTAVVHQKPNVVHVTENDLGNVVSKLSAGDSFGEKALMEQGSLRNASIVCGPHAPLELAFLELPAFLSLIKKNATIKTLSFQESKHKNDLLKKKAQKEADKVFVTKTLRSTPISFFKTWSDVQRSRIAVHSELIKIEGGSRVVLVEQNSHAKHLYLLIKGTYEQTWEQPATATKDTFEQLGKNAPRTTKTQILKADSIFGEYELLSAEPRYIYSLSISSGICIKIKFSAIMSILKDNQENKPLNSSKYLNGLFARRMTAKYDYYRSLHNLWGSLSSHGRSVLYNNSYVVHYGLHDKVEPSKTLYNKNKLIETRNKKNNKNSGVTDTNNTSNNGSYVGVRYGFVVDGQCNLIKKIHVPQQTPFSGTPRPHKPRPPKKVNAQIAPIEGYSRAARLNIRHCHKPPSSLPTKKHGGQEQEPQKLKPNTVANVGLLHRMSLLPLDQAVDIVAHSKEMVVLYTEWFNQLSKKDLDRLQDLSMQIAAFVETRLLHIQDEAASATRTTNNRLVPSPNKTTALKQSSYRKPALSINAGRAKKPTTTYIPITSSQNGKNSKMSTAKAVKHLHLITQSFAPDAHSLAISRLDSLLDQRHTGYLDELHPSLTHYTPPEERSNREEEHNAQGSPGGRRVAGSVGSVGSAGSAGSLVPRKKKKPMNTSRLPLNMAQRAYQRHGTDGNRSKKNKSSANGSFYMLEHVNYNPQMNQYDEAARAAKSKEIIEMLSTELHTDTFDYIQRNRSLLLK